MQLRVGLAQVDTRVGDLAGNADLVRTWTAKAAEDGVHLVVFPEMTLTGYPPEDLVLRESFAHASEHAARRPRRRRWPTQGLGDVAVVVGYLAHTEGSRAGAGRVARRRTTTGPVDANPRRGAPRNAAALLYGGEVVARYYKRHLPNYGVFDEARYFVPGTELPVVRLHGVDIALTICEDLWVEGGPCGVAGQAGVDLVVSPNASPVRAGQGRPAAAAGPPPGRRGAGDRSSTATRSAGRTSWSSTATRWPSPPTATCSPAHRSSSSTC